jgi:hypothetical protein
LHLRWNLFSKNRRAVHCVYLNTMTDCRHRQSRRHKELAMLKPSALLAIAASATVGLTMLAPTDASARNGGGPHFRVAQVGRIAGPVHTGFYNRRVIVNQRFVFNRRFVAGPVYGYNNWRWGVRPGFCWRHPIYCRAHFGGYRIAVPVVAAPVIAAPVVAPIARCLRQIRLADGSSLFRNLCTNEAAITGNLPEGEPAPLK